LKSGFIICFGHTLFSCKVCLLEYTRQFLPPVTIFTYIKNQIFTNNKRKVNTSVVFIKLEKHAFYLIFECSNSYTFHRKIYSTNDSLSKEFDGVGQNHIGDYRIATSLKSTLARNTQLKQGKQSNSEKSNITDFEI
jgi:hypothetical protein